MQKIRLIREHRVIGAFLRFLTIGSYPLSIVNYSTPKEGKTMLFPILSANSGIGTSAIYAILGYGVVFFGLILLMTVIILLGKCFTLKHKKAAPAPVVPVAEPVSAPGAAGQLKLYNVDPKTAAILMAITANKLGKPINELRFLSIKEVTE